jgi:uncharacterized protein (TIGR03790 family)
MKIVRLVFLFGCLILFFYSIRPVSAGYYDYNDVLLIVNDNSPISVQVGDYFKQQRNIPDKNVVHLHTVTTESASLVEFTNNIRTPIENYLTSNSMKDSINYLVTTKGMPLILSGTSRSIEQSLMLILGQYSSLIGTGTNSYSSYQSQDERFSRVKYDFYLATRLDGYNLDEIKAIIDRSGNPASADQGIFVFDVTPGRDSGGYMYYNNDMRAAAMMLIDAGYHVIFDQNSAYLTNQKNVLGYYSWGSNDGAGANHAIPGNTYANGAIGDTYVSTSGRSFNYPPSYGQSLIADWIHEGISGMAGYVAEPYASAMAVPPILVERYTRGYNLADSYGMASEDFNWRQVVIGDPKTVIVEESDLSRVNSLPPVRFMANGALWYSPAWNAPTGFSTNKLSHCRYSTSPNVSYTSMTNNEDSTGFSIYHYFTFPNLVSGNHYVFYARCQDEGGHANTTDFPIIISVAGGTDTSPPGRTRGYPSGSLPSGQNQASLVMVTDEAATCKYSTTSNVAYASMTNSFTAAPDSLLHTAMVSGLSDGSSYTYYVRCKDSANNANADDYSISFSVANSGPEPNYSNADINKDLKINTIDFNILKSDFLKLTANLTNPRSDINGDGQATVKDLGIMMSGWKP